MLLPGVPVGDFNHTSPFPGLGIFTLIPLLNHHKTLSQSSLPACSLSQCILGLLGNLFCPESLTMWEIHLFIPSQGWVGGWVGGCVCVCVCVWRERVSKITLYLGWESILYLKGDHSSAALLFSPGCPMKYRTKLLVHPLGLSTIQNIPWPTMISVYLLFPLSGMSFLLPFPPSFSNSQTTSSSPMATKCFPQPLRSIKNMMSS